MKTSFRKSLLALSSIVLLSGCASANSVKTVIDTASSTPGSIVAMRGAPLKLTGTALLVGEQLPSVQLTDAYSMEKVDLSKLRGSVLLISLVPSIDTKVCEIQTHYLGDEGARLPAGITRITVSRHTLCPETFCRGGQAEQHNLPVRLPGRFFRQGDRVAVG